MRSHTTAVENLKTGADMKYELNTWYHYDDAAKKQFERWAPVEAAAAGCLVLACKRWNEETDKFYVQLFYGCYYGSKGRFIHVANSPTFENVLNGKPIAFMLLPPKYVTFEDFMHGVKYHA